MNYEVKNLRLAGNRWKCTLQFWEGCKCGGFEDVEVEVFQERRPTLAVIVEAYKESLSEKT